MLGWSYFRHVGMNNKINFLPVSFYIFIVALINLSHMAHICGSHVSIGQHCFRIYIMFYKKKSDLERQLFFLSSLSIPIFNG